MNDEKLESTCMQIDEDLASGANIGIFTCDFRQFWMIACESMGAGIL